MTHHPLEVTGVSKFYENLAAVNNVSFCVQKGEIFGLLGPNGAGKSTLISMITTLKRISIGQITTFGLDVSKNSWQAKLQIGLVPQEVVSHGYFSVWEVLKFYSGYYGISSNEKRITYLLKRLKLWEHKDKKVTQLSGGMKRRLLITKALLHKPKLLLLDEPTAGVDVELRRTLWDLVKELNQEGLTVLLTTHYLEEAEALCDRVAIIHEGEIKRLDQTQKVIKDLTQREIRIKVKDQNCPKTCSAYWTGQNGDYFVFKIPSNMTVGQFLEEMDLSLSLIEDLQIKEGSLEEAFEKVVAGE